MNKCKDVKIIFTIKSNLIHRKNSGNLLCNPAPIESLSIINRKYTYWEFDDIRSYSVTFWYILAGVLGLPFHITNYTKAILHYIQHIHTILQSLKTAEFKETHINAKLQTSNFCNGRNL